MLSREEGGQLVSNSVDNEYGGLQSMYDQPAPHMELQPTSTWNCKEVPLSRRQDTGRSSEVSCFSCLSHFVSEHQSCALNVASLPPERCAECSNMSQCCTCYIAIMATLLSVTAQPLPANKKSVQYS